MRSFLRISSAKSCLCLAMVLVACTTQAAPDSPSALLRKALRGVHRGYTGVQKTTVFLTEGTEPTTVRVWADGRGGIRRQYLSGAAKGVVLLQNRSGSWQRPPDGTFQSLPSAGSLTPDEVADAMIRNYKLSVSEGRRYAGIRTRRIAIRPRESWRPSRSLSIDPSTGLVLQDATYAPDGRTRSITEYISVQYAAQPAGLFETPKNAARTDDASPGSYTARASNDQVRADTGLPAPVPRYLPKGFRQISQGVLSSSAGVKTPASRYGDGLAAISIFVQGGVGDMGFDQVPGADTGTRGRRRYRWRRGIEMGRTPGAPIIETDRQRTTISIERYRLSYVVIGDIHVDELLRVAQSLP